MFYDIVKTGFIIEFNDTAEIVRYNTTTAVRRAMCCAVASARDIGRRRDQGPGRGCRAHTSGPRLPAPSSSVPVIGKITSQCLSLNSAVTSEVDTRRKVLLSFEFIWSLDQHSHLGNSQCVKMGCAHASKILTNDDIEFIAKNTALSKDQVEVFK